MKCKSTIDEIEIEINKENCLKYCKWGFAEKNPIINNLYITCCAICTNYKTSERPHCVSGKEDWSGFRIEPELIIDDIVEF